MVKQTFFLLMLAGIMFSSCSVSKSARTQRNLFSGSWTLDNISYENNTGNFKSTIFGDAEDICFEGSDWFFRPGAPDSIRSLKQGGAISRYEDHGPRSPGRFHVGMNHRIYGSFNRSPCF